MIHIHSESGIGKLKPELVWPPKRARDQRKRVEGRLCKRGSEEGKCIFATCGQSITVKTMMARLLVMMRRRLSTLIRTIQMTKMNNSYYISYDVVF